MRLARQTARLQTAFAPPWVLTTLMAGLGAASCGRVGYDAELPAPAGVIDAAGVIEGTWQVSADDRDAWDDRAEGDIGRCMFGDGSWNDAAGYQWATSIPRASMIVSAKIKLYSTRHQGQTGSYTVGIHVEDVDGAAPFSGVVLDIYDRTYWGTAIDWIIPAAGLPIDAWSESPELAALVQHIVDRPGWSEGNYLSMALWGETDVGGSNEVIGDFRVEPSTAATLEVSYVAPP